MTTKWHINDKSEVGRCSATKGNCPFGGASGLENHYSSQEEAEKFIASSMDGYSSMGTSSKRRPSVAFRNSRDSLKKSLVDYGVSTSNELPEVRTVSEIVQHWFAGDKKKYEAFKKLVNDQTMNAASKKSVAQLIDRGLSVDQVKTVDKLSKNATVDILDDSLRGISLKELRERRPF